MEAVYINTGNFAYKDRFFVALISGVLATNPLYQPQLKENFELVRFKVIAPAYRIVNSPPMISKFVSQFTVYANESK